MSTPHQRSEETLDATTLHVRRAREGDVASLEWLVGRMTPLLLIQARHRMGPRLLARLEPEDLVNDVWATVLPRLPELPRRDGRATPVLLRFLSTTLLHHVNNLLRKRATGNETPDSDPLGGLPEHTRGPLTRVVEAEKEGIALAALDELAERDREVVLLRVLEQHSNRDVAHLLAIEPATAAQIYRRALEKLRGKLPGSVFDDLAP